MRLTNFFKAMPQDLTGLGGQSQHFEKIPWWTGNHSDICFGSMSLYWLAFFHTSHMQQQINANRRYSMTLCEHSPRPLPNSGVCLRPVPILVQ